MTLFCLVAGAAAYGRPWLSASCDLGRPADASPDSDFRIYVEPRTIHVGDEVCVQLSPPAVAPEAGRTAAPASAPPVARRWHLFLNDVDVAQTTGADAVPGQSSSLSFALPAPTSASSPTARSIAALWTGGLTSGGDRPAALRLHADAVGPLAGHDLTRRGPVALHVFDPSVAFGGLALLLSFSAGLVWLARNTSLLRDEPDLGSPTSLARTQMAFWFALSIAGFCYIWLLTGIWQDVVTPQTLVLLGISATVGVAATAIASPKSSAKSAGFLLDILSEQESDDQPAGVTIHRVVMAAWTVVLGGVFVNTVLWTQRFPTFDPTLLVLLGISSGVYVGFKWLDS